MTGIKMSVSRRSLGGGVAVATAASVIPANALPYAQHGNVRDLTATLRLRDGSPIRPTRGLVFSEPATPEWAQRQLDPDKELAMRLFEETYRRLDPSAPMPVAVTSGGERRPRVIQPSTKQSVRVSIDFGGEYLYARERTLRLSATYPAATPWYALYRVSDAVFPIYGSDFGGLLTRVGNWRNSNAEFPGEPKLRTFNDGYWLMFEELDPVVELNDKGNPVIRRATYEEIRSRRNFLRRGPSGFTTHIIMNRRIFIPDEFLVMAADPSKAGRKFLKALNRLINAHKNGVQPHILFAFVYEPDFRNITDAEQPE